MSTALKELPKLVVPSGLLGRIVAVNAAVEKATREVSSQHKMASLCVNQGVNNCLYYYIVGSFRATTSCCC